jgi:tetratricopeptide (TPR) repeat protein
VALGTAAAFLALVVGATIFSAREAIRARRAERVAEAVNGFLQNDLLAQASSSRQGGAGTTPDPDIKVRTALDQAAHSVGGRFAGQPEVEAGLRRAIGVTYEDLGLTGPAREQFEKALALLRADGNRKEELAVSSQLASIEVDDGKFAAAEALAQQTLAEQRRLLGPRDSAVLETMDVLGRALQKQDKFGEAEKLELELLDLRRKAGSESRDTLNTQLTLGAIYRGESKRKEAEATDREVLEKARLVLGAEHPLTLTAMSNLAEDCAADSKFPEALALATQTLEIKRRVLGPDHPETIGAINNLAGNYWLAGKYPESEKMYSQVVDAFTKMKGAEHPDTLEAEDNLATSYINERRFAEAQVLLEKILPQHERALGPGHQLSLNTADMLAKVYSIQGKHAQAEAIQVAAVETARKKLGAMHDQTLQMMNNLALIYRNENKLAEAEKVQIETVNGERAKNGPEHPDTLFVLTNLAVWKALQHKYQEAIDVLKPVLEVRTRRTPEDWQRFRCEYLLGSDLASDKQYAEAEPHLLKGFDGLVERRANIPADALVNIPNCAKDLVKMYQAQGKAEQAARWQAKLKEPAIESLTKP